MRPGSQLTYTKLSITTHMTMIRNSNGFTEYQIIDMYCTVVGMDNTPNYKLATHIVCPLLVMVTF